MPRAVAATLVVLLELASVLVFLGLLIPPIIEQVTRVALVLPNLLEPGALRDELRDTVSTLPEPARSLVTDLITQGAGTVRENASVYLQGAASFALAGALRFLSTLGFMLGLLAIPTWLIAVVSDQRVGKRSLDALLPASVRPDFWAVVQIIDRTLGTYLRGQVLAALAVGTATYVGLTVLDRFVWPGIQYQLLLAMLAGALNLIPVLGPVLAAIPAVALGLTVSPQAALGILGLYVLIQRLEAMYIQPMIERRSVDIHPALLVVLLVALAQFGFVWVLLGAPIAVAARDLFRYAYGRVGDPPRPAGVLPEWARSRVQPRIAPVRMRAVPRVASR